MPRPRVDLPEYDEPLETEGKQISPVAARQRRMVEIPSNSEAVAVIEGTRRKLSDLPVTPKHLNPIACICLYTLYGLDIHEIGVATGLGMDQINKVRMSNEYGMMQKAVIDTILEAETGEVKDYVKKAAQTAAERVATLVQHDNPDIALRASKDVLDRAGLRPADVVELRGRMDVGLVIEVVDKKDDKDRPIIDMETD